MEFPILLHFKFCVLYFEFNLERNKISFNRVQLVGN